MTRHAPGWELCLSYRPANRRGSVPFTDKPLAELVANGHRCLAPVLYLTSRQATAVKGYAAGGSARLLSGVVWDLAAARFTDAREPA